MTAKTRDELAQSYYRMYRAMKQNKVKLASGELDNDDIWEMAFKQADNEIDRRLRKAEVQEESTVHRTKELIDFRENREKEYHSAYDWNSSNDERSLTHIIDTEVLLFEIQRDLKNITLSFADREKLMARHERLAALHADLLIKAGIDRPAREKKQATNEPFEDWIRVKRQGDEKMQELMREFPEALANCKTEAEIRDIMKYHLGYPFDIVDATLRHHRRVLGLPEFDSLV